MAQDPVAANLHAWQALALFPKAPSSSWSGRSRTGAGGATEQYNFTCVGINFSCWSPCLRKTFDCLWHTTPTMQNKSSALHQHKFSPMRTKQPKLHCTASTKTALWTKTALHQPKTALWTKTARTASHQNKHCTMNKHYTALHSTFTQSSQHGCKYQQIWKYGSSIS